MTDLSHSTAAERNKQPILDVLEKVLGARGAALEIASGTGQHAAWFAAALPGWTWQPTDADSRALPSLAARVAQSGLANLRPPLLLDVTAAQWPSQGPAFTQQFDAIYCANMLHIAPPAACVGLMEAPRGSCSPAAGWSPTAPTSRTLRRRRATSHSTRACAPAMRHGAFAG